MILCFRVSVPAGTSPVCGRVVCLHPLSRFGGSRLFSDPSISQTLHFTRINVSLLNVVVGKGVPEDGMFNVAPECTPRVFILELRSISIMGLFH